MMLYLLTLLLVLMLRDLTRIFHQNGKKVDFIYEKHGVKRYLQKYTLYLNGFMKKMAAYLE